MDDAGAEHTRDLDNQNAMIFATCSALSASSLSRGGGVAIGVGHQFHEQHAFHKLIGLWDTHTGVGEAVQSVHLRPTTKRRISVIVYLGHLGVFGRRASLNEANVVMQSLNPKFILHKYAALFE